MEHFHTEPGRRIELFERYGLTPQNTVLFNYDIYIEVAPATTARP
jgi:hypothetical protein